MTPDLPTRVREALDATRTLDLPVKLNDGYTCQGRDANGHPVVFDDLLSEGEQVATASDDRGNTWGPYGVVVKRGDGLWIEAPA